MEKFVVVATDDATGMLKYWDGKVMQYEANACFLYPTVIDARSAMANLISVFSEADLSVRKARISLTIE